MRNRSAFILALASFATFATACSSEGDTPSTAPPAAPQTNADVQPTLPATTLPPSTAAPVKATFATQPGVEQFAITGAAPGAEIGLRNPGGDIIASGTVDEAGALLFRRIQPGDYTAVGPAGEISDTGHVLARDEHPPQRFFDEATLNGGFGYIATRDGTTLSATVHLPGPVESGPYPTVVEYSGYTPSNPDDATFAQLYNALGFAYVGVNIRGTGCSGGSFRFFEYTQSTDGYDVIETVAAQPWVQHNSVGMVGISYPGISQLFVAQTQPPSLAAITPLSVLDDSIRATLYPGGILNTGFAVPWTKDRLEQSKPRGQAWAADRIDAGDERCARNQELRLQNPDLLHEITENEFYTPEVGDDINPSLFVDKITVPVFLAGAWQDEQTGGHFPDFLDRFTGTEKLFVTLVNGLHTESIASTAIFQRYAEFLDLYVARRAPTVAAPLVGPALGQAITGAPAPIAQSELAALPYPQAMAAYEARPRIRVLFEEGAADGQPAGAAAPRFEAGFSEWPIPETVATTWFLNADGSTNANGAAATSTPRSYTADPDATPDTFFDGGSSEVWRADVAFEWPTNPPGTALVWTSEALTADLALVGNASADLWIRSTSTNTDVEVTLSEIRPDGTEMYIQSGWLRASHRGLDESLTTALRPYHPLTEAAAAPLRDGEFSLARVAILPFGHVLRAGSKLRVTVDSPGGNRATWAFATIVDGETNEIATGGSTASAIVLPVVPGVIAPPGLPSCGSLRGQPCRPIG